MTIRIFYSNASRDERLRKELAKHLTILEEQYLITTWNSGEVIAGAEYEREVSERLNEANLILLLVSPDFVASIDCQLQTKRAMERHKVEKIHVIPIILRSIDWKNLSFGQLQALPKNGKPVTKWTDKDEAFFDIAREIRSIVITIKEQLDKGLERTRIGDATVAAFEEDEDFDYEALNHEIARLHQYRADTLTQRQYYEEALNIYDQALRLDPNDALTYSGKGDALKELHRYEEALIAYERALFLEPKDAPNYINKGDVLKELNRNEEALIAYEQALRLDPSAYIYKALTVAEQELRLNPNNAVAYRNMGDAFFQLRQYEQALGAYGQALHLNPKDPLAYSGKGDVLCNLRSIEKALEAYEQALKLDPHNRTTYIDKIIAACNQASSNNERHTSAFTGEGRFDITKASIYLKAGAILLRCQQYEQALNAYEQAICLAPLLATAYNGKGSAFYNLDRYEEALDSYEQALHLNPNYTLAHTNKTLVEAELSLRINPHDILACLQKGNAFFQFQYYEQALDAYEQALHIDPDNTFARDGKAQALQYLGRL